MTQKMSHRLAKMPEFQENWSSIDVWEGDKFHAQRSGSFACKYTMKQEWAIFQFYGLFPPRSEPKIAEVAESVGENFFLDWTFEAQSWFLAVDCRTMPSVAKSFQDNIAATTMQSLNREAQEAAKAVRERGRRTG